MIILTKDQRTGWPAWAWTTGHPPEYRAMAVYRYLCQQLAAQQTRYYRSVTLAGLATSALLGTAAVSGAPGQALQIPALISGLLTLWLLWDPCPEELAMMQLAQRQLAAHPLDPATQQALRDSLTCLTHSRWSYPQDRAIRAALAITPTTTEGA